MYSAPRPSLPGSPKEASGLLRSTVPSSANPILSQLSYGRRAIPNLVPRINKVKDLSDPKLPTQQRALVNLTELFHAPANIQQGISENIVRHLIEFLTSQNITCRQKASECLRILSGHAIGRNAIFYDPTNLAKMSRNVPIVNLVWRR